MRFVREPTVQEWIAGNTVSSFICNKHKKERKYMIGYIYLTTNLVNDRMYVGKHLSTTHDTTYYGSGKILLQAIHKYGKENFSNVILYEAQSIDELNDAEKRLIAQYKKEFGDKMYNIAEGGDGGDTLSGKSEEERLAFIEKMTAINKQRCNTPEFKQKLSEAGHKRYADAKERELQSQKIHKAWSNPQLKKEQSERVKEQHKNGLHDYTHMCKPCIFELQGTKKEFPSLQKLLDFLDTTYGYRPGHKKLKQIMIDGKQGIPFSHNHKNRYKAIIGMLIYYK